MIFYYIWEHRGPDGKPANLFIIKGPRGGGKTLIMGALGFVKWFLKSRSIVALGGSLMQAQNLYNYFTGHCYANESFVEALPSEPTMSKTLNDKGKYFRAVAASQKQIRGPHPDELYIDEACEAKDDIIVSALPMVSSSESPVIVLSSTFHKIFGYFQETWDNATKLGFVRLSWDIFDVIESFDASIWDNPTYNNEIPDFQLLKERSGGRLGDPEGWIKIENIIQAWRQKPSVDWFDVEYMGRRPSAEGLVNDPADVDACIVENLNQYRIHEGAETVIGIDWGYSGMTSIVEFMNFIEGLKIQTHNKNYSQTALDVIIQHVVKRVLARKIEYIYADSAGKFENVALQNALIEALEPYRDRKCTVIEVAFSKFKPEMLSNYRSYFQRRLLRIPKSDEVAIWQHKRYHYAKGSDKPEKEDDHIPDATMLCLKHWMLGIPVAHIPDNSTHVAKKTERNPDRGFDDEIEDDLRRERESTLTGGLLGKVF